MDQRDQVQQITKNRTEQMYLIRFFSIIVRIVYGVNGKKIEL